MQQKHSIAVGDIYFDDINLERSYASSKCYAQSKLANILFTKELANRLRSMPKILQIRIDYIYSVLGLINIYHRQSVVCYAVKKNAQKINSTYTKCDYKKL